MESRGPVRFQRQQQRREQQRRQRPLLTRWRQRAQHQHPCCGGGAASGVSSSVRKYTYDQRVQCTPTPRALCRCCCRRFSNGPSPPLLLPRELLAEGTVPAGGAPSVPLGRQQTTLWTATVTEAAPGEACAVSSANSFSIRCFTSSKSAALGRSGRARAW